MFGNGRKHKTKAKVITREAQWTKNFDISIAGELNLDLILYGLPIEMQTERELLATDFRATLGSSSAIVAHNAATLGARVAFTTLIGPDEFGAFGPRPAACSRG